MNAQRLPLHQAVIGNNRTSARRLLGSDKARRLEEPDEAGCTPIMVATILGRFDMVKLLIAEGADLTARDKGRRTCMLWAAAEGCDGILSLLAGTDTFDISVTTRSLNTALHRAAAYGRISTTLLLLGLGAGEHIDAKNAEGCTPLIRAARWGHADVVRALLRGGADWRVEPDVGLSAGKSARSWAERKDHQAVIQELLRWEGLTDEQRQQESERGRCNAQRAVRRAAAAAAAGHASYIAHAAKVGAAAASDSDGGDGESGTRARADSADSLGIRASPAPEAAAAPRQLPGPPARPPPSGGRHSLGLPPPPAIPANSGVAGAEDDGVVQSPIPHASPAGAAGAAGSSGAGDDDDDDEVDDDDARGDLTQREQKIMVRNVGGPRRVEGWMAKKGHFFRNWKTRWFVLEGNEMRYYGRQGDRAPKGRIQLEPGTTVAHRDDHPRPNCFAVNTPAKQFMLQATDEEEREEWMEAIRNNLSIEAGDA